MQMRPTGVASKILDKKWKQKEHDIHKQRLRAIKGSLDMRQRPQSMRAGTRNAKRDAMVESKFHFLTLSSFH